MTQTIELGVDEMRKAKELNASLAFLNIMKIPKEWDGETPFTYAVGEIRRTTGVVSYIPVKYVGKDTNGKLKLNMLKDAYPYMGALTDEYVKLYPVINEVGNYGKSEGTGEKPAAARGRKPKEQEQE